MSRARSTIASTTTGTAGDAVSMNTTTTSNASTNNATGPTLTTTQSMLAAAKARANRAVLMDGANNTEEALVAYNDAVQLLTMAMERMSAAHDVERLRMIRDTYVERIETLKQELLDMSAISDDAAYDYTSESQPMAVEYRREDWSALQSRATPVRQASHASSPRGVAYTSASSQSPTQESVLGSMSATSSTGVLSPRSSSFAASMALSGERPSMHSIQSQLTRASQSNTVASATVPISALPLQPPTPQPLSPPPPPPSLSSSPSSSSQISNQEADTNSRYTNPASVRNDLRRGRLPPPPKHPPPMSRSANSSTSGLTLSLSASALVPPNTPPSNTSSPTMSPIRRRASPVSTSPNGQNNRQKRTTVHRQRSMPSMANEQDGQSTSTQQAMSPTTRFTNSKMATMGRSAESVLLSNGEVAEHDTSLGSPDRSRIPRLTPVMSSRELSPNRLNMHHHNASGSLVSRSFSPVHHKTRSGILVDRSSDSNILDAENKSSEQSNSIPFTRVSSLERLRGRQRSGSSPASGLPREMHAATMGRKPSPLSQDDTSSTRSDRTAEAALLRHRRSSSETTRITPSALALESTDEKLSGSNGSFTEHARKSSQHQKTLSEHQYSFVSSKREGHASADAIVSRNDTSAEATNGSKQSSTASNANASEQTSNTAASAQNQSDPEHDSQSSNNHLSTNTKSEPSMPLSRNVSPNIRPIDGSERPPLSEVAPFMFEEPNFLPKSVASPPSGRTSFSSITGRRNRSAVDGSRGDVTKLDMSVVKNEPHELSPTSMIAGGRDRRHNLSRSSSITSLKQGLDHEYGDVDDNGLLVGGRLAGASISSTSIDRMPRRKRSLAQLFHRRKQSNTSDIEKMPSLPIAEIPSVRSSANMSIDSEIHMEEPNSVMSPGLSGHRRMPSDVDGTHSSMLAKTINAHRRMRNIIVIETYNNGSKAQQRGSTFSAHDIDSVGEYSRMADSTDNLSISGAIRHAQPVSRLPLSTNLRSTTHQSNSKSGFTSTTTTASATLFDIIREEPSTNETLEHPPTYPELRPFWMMRCLERSINHGGFITDKLFVPRSLWFTSGVKLTAVDTKIQICERLRDRLEKMAAVDLDDTENTLSLLDELDEELYIMQNQLARKLDFIKEAKRTKNSGLGIKSFNIGLKSVERIHANMTKDKMEDLGEYVEALAKLFHACQLLDHWLRYYSAQTTSKERDHAVQRLNHASDFMRTVVCAFVLRDLTLLYDKYAKRIREWITD